MSRDRAGWRDEPPEAWDRAAAAARAAAPPAAKPCGCTHDGPCRESECGHHEWQDAARAAAPPVEPSDDILRDMEQGDIPHTHQWMDGKLLTNGCPLPHAARAAAPPVEPEKCARCSEVADSGVHDTFETCEAVRGPCLDPARHHPFVPPSPDREAGLREADWSDELALIIAKARFGPGVDMGGRHNPTPSEYEAARQFVADFRAALLASDKPGLDEERLGDILAEYADKAGHILPPLRDDPWRLETPHEFARTLAARLNGGSDD